MFKVHLSYLGVLILLCGFFIYVLLIREPPTVVSAEKDLGNCWEQIDSLRLGQADFVLKCIEAATSKTTGENQDAADWVKQCEYTAVHLFAKRRGDGWNESAFTHYCGEEP